MKDKDDRNKILLVEDELNLARPLQFNLEQEGYEVHSTPSGKKALEMIGGESFDLIILDLMLEEIDGFEVARQVRQNNQRLPILMLTARSDVQDRVHGLELGADDYITKPFNLKELLLRVERMIQRTAWYETDKSIPPQFTAAEHTIDLEKLTASGPRGQFQLTTLEANLLHTLAAQPNRVLSRSELLEKVWGYHSKVESRTVDNFILKLRQKIEIDSNHPQIILTVHGIGYKLVL